MWHMASQQACSCLLPSEDGAAIQQSHRCAYLHSQKLCEHGQQLWPKIVPLTMVLSAFIISLKE
jgi:hypothetical protein